MFMRRAYREKRCVGYALVVLSSQANLSPHTKVTFIKSRSRTKSLYDRIKETAL
jgi:hypothetical protein